MWRYAAWMDCGWFVPIDSGFAAAKSVVSVREANGEWERSRIHAD